MLNLLCHLLLAARRSRSAVADLIVSDPEGWDWTKDHYYLSHCRTGVRVWVANQIYGLHVEFDGRRVNPCWAERRLISKAYERGLKHRIARVEKAMEKKIRKAIEAAEEARS